MIATCYVGFIMVSGVLFNPCHISAVRETENSITKEKKCVVTYVSSKSKIYSFECGRLTKKLMEES